MARQPKQIHVFLYRQKKQNVYEYAIFQRADITYCWQGICGGLENDETIEEGARREIYEEAGITEHLPLQMLESISYLPDYLFNDNVRNIWGREIIVIPMFFLAMYFDGQVKLSDEHIDVKWLEYNDAYNLIYFRDQKTALYELNEKLIRDIIRRC